MWSLLILVLSLTACYSHTKGPLVTTPLGKIRGLHKRSFENRTFSAFEGIPFAKPPVGERRFEAPEPIEAWAKTWKATTLHGCVEVQTFNGFTTPGDEDCLYLNVYVPRRNPNPEEKLDVMVHIHGGAFMLGTGHKYAHPEYLMDRDVIFVTFNYRLGVFGFLSTEDDVVPGNNGLKDQVMALKWVQRNIAAFGGNPKSVTLTGFSSGGGSVHLHYLSPMSQGLFHRGYSQSGGAISPLTIQRGALTKAKFVASHVGCPSDGSDVLVKCLKKKTKEQILEQLKRMYQYKFYPTVLFGPVVEKGSNPFLTKEPASYLFARQVHDVPYLLSTVQEEGDNIFAGLKDNIDDLNTKWDTIAPIIYEYNCTVNIDRCKNISKQIRDFYLGPNQNISEANLEKFYKTATDLYIVSGAVKGATLQAAATKSPIYYYVFSYRGDSRVTGHGDDIPYFFYQNGRSPSKDELKMKDVMVDMLVSFAKTGKPTIDGPVWKPVKPDQFNFLNISGPRPEDMKLQTDGNLGSGDFWGSLALWEIPV